MIASDATPPSQLLPPARITLPILVLGGYVTLLITGYDTQLGMQHALPLYAFLCVLLLVLQIAISPRQSISRVFYVFISGAFAIFYAGERAFGPPTTGNFTKSPYTYIIINALFVVVFLFDVIDRRRQRGAASASETRPPSGGFYGSLATDFAGLAILFYLSWLILDLLGPQTILHAFGLGSATPYVTVDLRQSLGLSNLPDNVALLQNLDLVLGYGATAVTLLVLGLVGILSVAGSQGDGTTQSSTPPAPSSASFGGGLSSVLAAAGNQVLLSLRLVLGPLVWLIPAFSMTALAKGITSYLSASGSMSNASVLDLINPVSQSSLQNIPTGLSDIAWGFLAVAAVIFSVIIVEHDAAILRHTVEIFRVGGRALAVTLAFFLYSLAALNAFVLTLTTNKTEPFQVGTAGLIAILVTVGFVVMPPRMGRAKAPTPAPAN